MTVLNTLCSPMVYPWPSNVGLAAGPRGAKRRHLPAAQPAPLVAEAPDLATLPRQPAEVMTGVSDWNGWPRDLAQLTGRPRRFAFFEPRL